MKRIIISFFIILLLSSCSLTSVKDAKTSDLNNNKTKSQDYVKSVWIAYYELEEILKGCNEEQFKKKIYDSLKLLKEFGFNTVTVQVRPCADAFYRSDYFPSSKYCFSEQGAEMPFDPFDIICSSAYAAGLKVEAWINPYRVSQSNKIDELCDENVAKKWANKKSKKSNVYFSDEGIFFNPASDDVTGLIVNGVKELVKNYNISAIHFDDYFYPTTEKDIDEAEYKKYKADGGKLKLSEFRRENVSSMVKAVYNAVKKINKNVRFGISPSADIEFNRNVLYADVEKWISEEGYIDYICPQIYFGFKNVYKPFMFTVKKWMYLTKCDIYVGLPLYKAGKADKYAAEENKNIINEFKNNNNILSRQVTYLSKINEIKGFYIFSYSYLFSDSSKAEAENLIKAMQSINR